MLLRTRCWTWDSKAFTCSAQVYPARRTVDWDEEEMERLTSGAHRSISCGGWTQPFDDFARRPSPACGCPDAVLDEIRRFVATCERRARR